MRKLLVAAGCALWWPAIVGPAANAADTVTPQPMPLGMNYPMPGYVIEQWVEAGDIQRIRGHGWDVWNAMTQPSGQAYRIESRGYEQQLPIWDTWQSDNEIFNTDAKSVANDAKRTLHPFHLARQQVHGGVGVDAENPVPEGDIAISFNKFDPTASAFILADQTAADGTRHPINTQAGLAAINAAWPGTTAVGARAIRDFPSTAIETKPVFLPVLADALTPFPLWQGPAQSNNRKNPTPDTWNTCVLVDANNGAASGLRATTQQEITSRQPVANFNCQSFLYAPIGMFYAVMLDADGANAFNDLQGTTTEKGVTVAEGDFAVLAAMHVNTKEMDRWTWQTFYWQGVPDKDVDFPGSLLDQPATLAAPWNSYAMCTAYDQVVAGRQVVCFNPFLETSAGIPDGLNSNCVTCHGLASHGAGKTTNIYPPTYNSRIFPIPLDFNDPRYFAGKTKTDFSWAVAGSGSGTTIPK